ncbi:uncharacterized protein LOC133717976 [Rosa rugosa]|uniref:Uncharacterized protein n=1 Tax=Rosa chinensis TaxID=74649 RepID=A0A2P6SP64_ROSCH|nr:uncharacterized protein LOC112183887 [Rosa chinensis]XP_062000727.1 uncharacterized protein LOC133717976 [Rosa rugosa]PRQ60474.1 hypothetical protein RchiOBHm_Chr1g0381651 [Rosa chinensis]
MAQLRITFFILRVLLLSVLLISLSSGNNIVEGFKDGNDHHIDHLLHKGIKVNSRKLVMMLDATMHDYDDAGANPKHDPRRKPGNGRNP